MPVPFPTRYPPDTPDTQDENLRRARRIPTSLQEFLRPHGLVPWIQGHLQQGAILHPLHSSFPQLDVAHRQATIRRDFFFFFGITSKSLLFRITKYFDLASIFGVPVNSKYSPTGEGALIPAPVAAQHKTSMDSRKRDGKNNKPSGFGVQMSAEPHPGSRLVPEWREHRTKDQRTRMPKEQSAQAWAPHLYSPQASLRVCKGNPECWVQETAWSCHGPSACQHEAYTCWKVGQAEGQGSCPLSPGCQDSEMFLHAWIRT